MRAFFDDRGVLEVDTPVLGRGASLEPHLASLSLADPFDEARYLQTSPEAHMKRLLAVGSGPIFQIAHCFRAGEAGRLHNPEFLLLEWYRPGMSLAELCNEVGELISLLHPEIDAATETLDYGECFAGITGLDPHGCPDGALRAWLGEQDLPGDLPMRADCLDLAFSSRVVPRLAERGGLTWVQGFPVCMAQLARVDNDRAVRAELFWNGVEVANAYDELTDAQELARRCQAWAEARRGVGLPVPKVDAALQAAHAHGLPACAGVAVGFDRLLMLANGAPSLDAILPFTAARA